MLDYISKAIDQRQRCNAFTTQPERRLFRLKTLGHHNPPILEFPPLLKKNLLYNSLELPAYWRNTREMKAQLLPDWSVQRINYGNHPNHYVLSVGKLAWGEAEKPLAIYFHGGAWTFGSPERFLPAARLFLEAGYRVILPAYRRLPRHNFTHILADLENMRDRVLIDQKVEVVAGMSAGGHLAASIAWRPAFWQAIQADLPKKVILCGAPLNFSQMNLAPGLRLLCGKPGSPTFRAADPAQVFQEMLANWQNDQLPAHLFVHGTADATVAFKQLRSFYVNHAKNQPNFQHLWLENGTHLDSCRWMYRDDEVAEQIRLLLG